MRIWSGTAGTPGVIVNSGTAGAITSSPFGTGPITLGLNPADKGGIMANDLAPGTTILNEIVFNTALGNDNRGIRVENTATGLIFAGKITAAQANAVFTSGNAAAVSLTGKVTGAFGLETNNINSNVALTLNNAADDNDYAGNTIVGHSGALASTLALGRANQIPNGTGKGDVIVNGNFNLGGFSETINGLSGAATGIVDGVSGTPTLTVGDNDATSAFPGVIKNTAGTLALAKTGTGTLTLSGVNTFTGTTTISAGTLLVSGSISGSAVSVNGGTLGGSGGTTGAVTVATGGTIAPGSSVGTLNTGALTFTGGAFGLEINTTAVTSDLANVTGNLSLLGGASLSITDFAVSGTPLSIGQVFTFIDYSGAWDSGAFAGYADDSQFTLGLNDYRISYNGVDNATTAVTLEVVPEPGSAVLLLGGLAALAGIRRRRTAV